MTNARQEMLRDQSMRLHCALAESRPGFGLRGLVGEEVWAALDAENDHTFPVGWDERDALI